jgi:hypothetical protein
MWTRTSDRWQTVPGGWDKLNMQHRYPADNKYNIPDLKAPTTTELPEPPLCLIPYNIRVRAENGYADAAMHFFLDDYRFEFVWSNPKQSFLRIQKAWLALTPDFSLYLDYPLAAQIWNTYRNRWCGAHWRAQGLVVVPTVSWSDKRSYDFCFAGIERGSPVAVSTVGAKWDSDTKRAFEHGFNEMVARINPRFIICYGNINGLENTFKETEIKIYPTYWQSLKLARKQGQAEKFFTGETEVHKPQEN